MKGATQKRLVIAGVIVLVGIFVAANVHFISLAFQSQPECVAVESGARPAKHAC